MKYWTIIKIVVWPLSSPSDGGRRSHDQALAKKFHLFHLASYKLQVVQKRSDMQIWRHLAGGDAGTGVWSDQRGRAWKWTPGQIRHTHNSFIPANLLTTFGLRLKWKWTQNNTSDPQGWCSSPDLPSCPQQGNSQIGGEPEFGPNNQSSNQCN